MADLGQATYLDLDGAWGDLPIAINRIDAREWGPRLRYLARPTDVKDIWTEVGPRLSPFVLYGSGDYHFLAALLLRRITSPLTLVSFDNHPDWDIRPPRWACGGWINRALEFSNVERAAVWGCGNFELAMPSRLFANHRALRAGRLEVHPWAQRMPSSARRHFGCITRDTWRQRFEDFAATLVGKWVYVTVDLDCLDAAEAVTNWENGLFTAEDIAWAIRLLRDRSRVVGGDLCGAYSAPQYSRLSQRFAGWWDHPKMPDVDLASARQVNQKALLTIWPSLTGG
jgi:hypothetical protein